MLTLRRLFASEIPPEKREGWYKGLLEGNCKVLKDLLTDRRCLGLVWQGLIRRKPDVTSESLDRLPRVRTALHVAALRGCPELVQMVLEVTGGRAHPAAADQEILLATISNLRDLLLKKDPDYELDALAIAVSNGNWEIMSKLVEYEGSKNPYVTGTQMVNLEEIQNEREKVEQERAVEQNVNLRREISAITGKVKSKLVESEATWLATKYNEDVHVNFLPWQEYLFLFTFTSDDRSHVGLLNRVRKEIFRKAGKKSPAHQDFLLELKDGRGRTGLHAAVESRERDRVKEFIYISRSRQSKDWVNDLLDGVGRTALHWAAALGVDNSIPLLGRNSPKGAVYKATFVMSKYEANAPVRDKVSNDLRNGCGVTALHLAILHKHVNCVEALLDLGSEVTGIVFAHPGQKWGGEALELATIVRHTQIVRMLLSKKKAQDTSKIVRGLTPIYSAVNIAAAFGDFQLVKLFGDDFPDHPGLIKDIDGNTTLHHVMLGINTNCEGHPWSLLAKPFFLDFVSVEHFHDRQLLPTSAREKSDYVERQGCVELLLQAGFDPWELNKNNEAPYPGPEAPLQLLLWWIEKLSKQTVAAQKRLNAAANAVTVTSALVATASYVGPFRPPRGYESVDFLGEVQIQVVWVRIFEVCDTLSLFCALSAIMMALLPSLPLPRISEREARKELEWTRRIVNSAIGLLLVSIVLVLVGFAASSLAVIPTNKKSWKYGGLTMTTVAIGGLLSFVVICIFSFRVFVVFDLHSTRNPKVRKLYNIVFRLLASFCSLGSERLVVK